MTNVILMGNGMISIMCAKYILQRMPLLRLEKLIVDEGANKFGEGLDKFADQAHIPVFRSVDLRQDAGPHRPDEVNSKIFLSVGNSQVLSEDILNSYKLAINFHNSLLPFHAGFNPCTWAIAEGDRDFGVTFHKMIAQVDQGDILIQEKFEIDPGWTAGDLLCASLERGFRVFRENAHAMMDLKIKPIRQTPTRGSYHRRKELPNGGRMTFDHSTPKIWNYYRAFRYPLLKSPVPALKWIMDDEVWNIAQMLKTDRLPSKPAGTLELMGSRRFVHGKDSIFELIEANRLKGQNA